MLLSDRDCASDELNTSTNLCPARCPALASSCRPATDWQQLHSAAAGARAMRAILAAGDATAMHVVVDNRLGTAAAMELDFGDHL